MSAGIGRLIGEHIPTTDGRQLLVRPALGGEGVQLAIIGKRGSMVEAVCIGLDQVGSFVLVVDGISEIAWAQNEKQLQRSRRSRERRHAAALANNPWLKKRRRHDNREVRAHG